MGIITLDTNAILRLYSSVLHEDIISNKIPDRDIRMGVRDMALAYKPESSNFGNDISDCKFTDYNIPGFRCAYLHKYAPLHTYIVLDIMTKLLNAETLQFKNVLNSKQFKLCCLGGGPGSDAVGALAALHTVFGSFKSSVTIIDCMEQWKHTFSLVVDHLCYGGFGTHWKSLQWDYIGADLLNIKNMTVPVNNAINTASLVTMVKFISAATCTNTEPMVEKIFRMMRPGALLLFIDNAAGGFTQVIERAGKKFNFQMIAGPFRHMDYLMEDLKVERFGYTSCFHTKVTIILMKKPGDNQNEVLNSYNQSISGRNMPLRSVQNMNEVAAQMHLAGIQSMFRNTAQSPSQINNSSQSMSAAKSKAHLLSAVQSFNKTSSQILAPAQENINKSMLSNKTQSSSKPKSSSQSISATKKRAPLPTDVHSANKASSQVRAAAQGNTNKSVPHQNRITSAVSTLSRNDNRRHRPSYCHSITRAATLNNLNRPQERFHSRTAVSSSPTNSVISSQPFISPSERDSPSDNIDYSNDTCCSCCTIS